MPSPKILIVDDEKNILTSLQTALSLEGFDVSVAGSGEIALQKVKDELIDLILLDVKMPGIDGLETLRRLKTVRPWLPVVMMSGHGNIQTALEAIRSGATDFVEKPLSTDRLVLTISNVLQIKELVDENIELKIASEEGLEIVGESEGLAGVMRTVAKAGPSASRVLILGENGTGKELIAKAVHAASPRAKKPFVKVNCAAIPADLIESELFGHVKGAFTGAHSNRKGKFELADGGTLFLDEIGDMKLEMQSKLLRVLQESEFEPVGSENTVSVDVRVLAATNRNLDELIQAEEFRQDLYYRLAVIPISVPPLRERLDDIELLVSHFCNKISEENNKAQVKFEDGAIQKLKTHNWPGNIRELKNIVERLIILSESERVRVEDVARVLPTTDLLATGAVQMMGQPLKDLVANFEKKAIEMALERNSYHVSNAARDLGLERSHLYKKMKAYDIQHRP